jgi:hypothetical protein
MDFAALLQPEKTPITIAPTLRPPIVATTEPAMVTERAKIIRMEPLALSPPALTETLKVLLIAIH